MLLLSFLIKKLILSLPLLCAGARGGGLLLEMAGLNQLPPNPCCGAADLVLHLRGVGAGAGDITTNFSFVPPSSQHHPHGWKSRAHLSILAEDDTGATQK